MKKAMIIFLWVCCFGFMPICDYAESQISQEFSIAPFRYIENNFGGGFPVSGALPGKGVFVIDKKYYGKDMLAFAGEYNVKTNDAISTVCLFECTESGLKLIYKQDVASEIKFISHDAERKEIFIALELESDNCLYIDLTKDVLEMIYCESP